VVTDLKAAARVKLSSSLSERALMHRAAPDGQRQFGRVDNCDRDPRHGGNTLGTGRLLRKLPAGTGRLSRKSGSAAHYCGGLDDYRPGSHDRATFGDLTTARRPNLLRLCRPAALEMPLCQGIPHRTRHNTPRGIMGVIPISA
jgi:hypothetical protein